MAGYIGYMIMNNFITNIKLTAPNSRPKQKTVFKLEDKRLLRDILINSFGAFTARIQYGSDGRQDTNARLYINGCDYIDGRSGCGHAEMDALNKYFIQYNQAMTLTSYSQLSIECTSKPICCKCAIILGLFNISAKTGETYKSNKAMGSILWTLPTKVLDFTISRLITSHPNLQDFSIPAWKQVFNEIMDQLNVIPI